MNTITTPVRKINKQRVIFTCNTKCGHVWAREYFKHMTNGHLFRRVDGAAMIWREEDYKCPSCGNETYVSAEDVNGEVNEKHLCDARCMSAKTGACSCSCGGANHGIAHL